MINVPYHCHVQLPLNKEPGRFKNPLLRRMSDLEKAALECLAGFNHEQPHLFQEVLATDKGHFYFATSHGEIMSSLTIAQSLFNGENLCSPTAFQHSVSNAAAGYMAIAFKIRNPIITLSCGFLSLDKALYLLVNKIRCGICDHGILITASEVVTQNSLVTAEAELIVLTAPRCAGLKSLFQVNVPCQLNQVSPQFPSEIFNESANFSSTPLLNLTTKRQSFVRVTNSLAGERIVSTWRLLNGP